MKFLNFLQPSPVPMTVLEAELLIEIKLLRQEIKNFMSTVPAGEAALTQAIADMTTAVQAAVADIATLSSQLTALNSEDPAVQNLAAQLEVQVKALNEATTPVAAPQPGQSGSSSASVQSSPNAAAPSTGVL